MTKVLLKRSTRSKSDPSVKAQNEEGTGARQTQATITEVGRQLSFYVGPRGVASAAR